MSVKSVDHRDGQLLLESTADGIALQIVPQSGVYVPCTKWVTRYPEDLVLQMLRNKGLPYLIDEIRRDEDPTTIERMLKIDILSYVTKTEMVGARILDFGCGSGASSMVLARLFPNANIVGVELTQRHVETARARAKYYGVSDRVTFLQSPSPQSLPSDIGEFDFILFCAVFEHLLPEERPVMLKLLWERLRVGGSMFLNDTPFRWFPIETHTTSLPLINYLPNPVAFRVARKLSRRVSPQTSDNDLLRLGIRGGSRAEVMRLLSGFGAHAELRRPIHNDIRDEIDLWAAHSVGVRGGAKTQFLSLVFRFCKLLTGESVVPTLSLALKRLV